MAGLNAPRATYMHRYRNVELVGGGFVTGLVPHPTEAGLVYARTDVGGAYRRAPGQERWQPITDWIGQDEWRFTGVESIALDPTDPECVYLALGIYNRPELGPAAIARSADRGRSFRLVEVPFGMGGNEAGRGSGERLAVNPDEPRALLFGSRDRGLWHSKDCGETWQRVESFPLRRTALPNPTPGSWNYLTQEVGIVFVAFEPVRAAGRPRAVYAGLSVTDGGLYRSLDGGWSWQLMPGQPLGLRPIRCAIASNRVVYLTYGREPGPNTMHDGAVWRFEPDDARWTNITPETPAPERDEGFGYAGIAVAASDPALLVTTTAYRRHAGGDEVFRSRDGGAMWRAVGQPGRRDSSRAPWLRFGKAEAHVGHWMYALYVDPFDARHASYATGQTIWTTDDLDAVDRDALDRSAVDRSAVDRGAVDRSAVPSWYVDALGIEETVPLALLSPPRGPALIAGTGDISGFVLESVEGEAASADLDAGASEAGTKTAGASATATAGTDAPRQLLDPTFKDTTGLDCAELAPEIVVRVGSRGWNRAVDLHTGAYSLDGGNSWSAFASYPEADAAEGRVAVAADGSAWVWVPRGLGAWVTADRGASWQGCAGLDAGRWRVLSDRVDSGVFYALAAESGEARVSSDGGHTFHGAGTLGAAPLADACAVPRRAGELWVAADGRLLHSSDGARSWRELRTLTRVSHIAFGQSREPGGYPALFAVAKLGSVQGFYLSTDRGDTWSRLNDDQHQFGQIRAIAGDPRRFGRLYLATGGRGVICGELR